MAESVARVRILAQIEGLEGFDALQGAFKGLQRAIGPTETQLARARQDVIAFGEAGKRTEQVIKGQIEALRSLKTQAGTGGQLYTTLGADVRRLEGEVRDLSAAYVNLATGASYTARQLASLTPATRQPGMLDAQIRGMRQSLEEFKLLSRQYIQGIADINRATQEGARNQQDNNLFSNALNANSYLQGRNFFDAPAAFERQAAQGGLPGTLAAKQTEISRIKEQLQNVLRDASSFEPLLNDIRRIESRLATQATSTGGTRTSIPGLEGAGRDLGIDWQSARLQLGQLTTEYESLKRAQQEQVRVLETQLIEAEEDLQRVLNGTTKESEQLARAEERRLRIQEKVAGVQEASLKAPGAGGYRDDGGAMIARGSVSGRVELPIERPVREISQLYQSIGDIGLSPLLGDIERMGNSYKMVAYDIKNAAAASDGSLGSLQRQRQAWQALRETLSPLNKDYALIKREATTAISDIDRQMERLNPQGMRGKVGYVGQGIGAIASAGFFGGPEGALAGALGGGIGGKLGGAPGFATGAFIGSSIGAYASQMRQLVAQTTDYAAAVKKQEIALKGVSGGGVQYERAMAAVGRVMKDFNVPQLEATKGMTSLTAAVVGAGGKVADAELVFRNITAAIKATGGGAEQVEGALLALTQVFSKGKVSAEELQGQLGERLAGAVTMFAEATGRSLPQLQEDLQAGVVDLNDLMKFVVSLGDKYADAAMRMGKSSADAGERLRTTFSEVRKQIGDALLPLGAELQDTFGKALREATPAIISAAKGIAEALKFLLDNRQAIGSMLKFAATAATVALGMRGLSMAFKALSAAGIQLIIFLGKASTGLVTLNAKSIIAAMGIGKLATAVKALLRIGLITIGIEILGNAIGKFMEVKALREELEKLKKAAGDMSPLERAQKAMEGASRETIVESIRAQRKEYERLGEELDKLIKKRDAMRARDLEGSGFDVNRVMSWLGLGDIDGEIERLKLLRDNALGFTQLNPDDYTSDLTKEWQKRAEEANKSAAEDLIKTRKDAIRQIEDLERQSIEDMADLRKQTIKDAMDLERDLLDERKEIQREIAKLDREAVYDRTRSALNALIDDASRQGLSTDALEFERDLNEARTANQERLQQNKERFEDSVNGRARQLEDFKRKVAEAIANLLEAAAKQAGEIQRSYAVNVFDILQKAGEAAGEAMRQGAVDAKGILDGSGGSGDGVFGNQGSKLLEGLSRIKGAYSFRSADSTVKDGFYQSDPRENKFFDFNPGIGSQAADRLKKFTQNDIRAAVFTALGEAGPSGQGIWEVLANILVRATKNQNSSVARLVTLPSQYVANAKRGANERNIVDPAFGSQVFGARYEALVKQVNQDIMQPFINQVEGVLKRTPVRGGAVVTDWDDKDGWQAGADIALAGGRGAQIQNPFTSARVTGADSQFNPATGRGFGNWVTAEVEMNGRRFEVMWAHLDKIAVEIGDIVQMGQSIGTQGMTGSATGPHSSTHVNALDGGNPRAVLDAIIGAYTKGGGIQSVAMSGPAGSQRTALGGGMTTGPLPMPNLPKPFDTSGIFAGVDAAAKANDAADAMRLAKENAASWRAEVSDVEARISAANVEFRKLYQTSLGNLDSAQAYAELLRQGIRPELAQQIVENRKIAAVQEDLLLKAREWLELQVANTKLPEEQRKAYSDQLELVQEELDLQPLKLRALEQQYLMNEKIKESLVLPEYYAQLRTELEKMTATQQVIVSMAQTIETAMSSAMANAVTAMVTGTGSIKQAAADMLKSIGQSFVQMATQIIAKQMVMIVLGSIMKALGVSMPGGGGGNAATAMATNPNVAQYAPLPAAANGATFSYGTAKFAKGGVVSRPTFFKFANGGQMQNGVMGEAGPEAIVPLKRGFDGKLGIAQVRSPQGGDSRMRDMMGRSPAQQPAQSLNLKFETTKINGVEYVSKEQLELAMVQTRRQAANDGAKRGMNMTLDKIQNSPTTRSRVGIR